MIARALVEEIRRMLLADRLSQRKIAQTLGISRGTVNAIARGRRRDNSTRRCQCEEDEGFTPPTGMPARCPGCGGLTQMPCLLCYVRARNDARETAGPGLCRRPNRGTIALASGG
jgi:transcriptional regulator with XRE-family HTH domain